MKYEALVQKRIQAITEAVLDVMEVSEQELKQAARYRQRKHHIARCLLVNLLHSDGLNVVQIAVLLDRKNHSGVIYLLTKAHHKNMHSGAYRMLFKQITSDIVNT